MAAAERARQRHSRRLGRDRNVGAIRVERQWRAIHDALQHHRAALKAEHGAVGFAVGFRHRDGSETPERALIVFVEEKKSPQELGASGIRLLPNSVSIGRASVPIDVVEMGRIRPHNSGGDSLGRAVDQSEATLGVFAIDSLSRVPVALSAMHATGGRECPPEPPVSFVTPSNSRAGSHQPLGRVTKGTRTDTDAAKFELDGTVVASYQIRGIGTIDGWRRLSTTADRGLSVRAFGAVSGLLVGTVREPFAVIDDDQMSLDPGFLVEINTKPGDSGAALVDNQNRILGLLVGVAERNPDLRAFTPISLVLRTLGCDIPPGEANT